MFSDESLIPIEGMRDKVQWHDYHKLYIMTPYYEPYLSNVAHKEEGYTQACVPLASASKS